MESKLTTNIFIHSFILEVVKWRSMPQGSRLGPLPFTVMIDDLQTPCELQKYVDDTTLSELVTPSCSVSNMPSDFASLLSWTEDNNMQINISKTTCKEMVLGLGRLNIDNLPLLSTSLGSVERVTSFKLLGINLDAKFSWSLHIYFISAKASKRLYFLKHLKRAGVPADQLLHFYVAAIRPVLEYCAAVWHYAITHAQAQQLQSSLYNKSSK